MQRIHETLTPYLHDVKYECNADVDAHILGQDSESSHRIADNRLSQMWGMGDAMHRRSIVRIGRALADKDPETASLLDVGCGTGRFLTFVKVQKQRGGYSKLSVGLCQTVEVRIFRGGGLGIREMSCYITEESG